MKKLTALLFVAITLLFTSCLEMGDSTTINSDGSGIFVCSADLSGVVKMAFEKEKNSSDNKPFQNVTKIDTTVYLRDIVREMDWPEENKRLVKEMMLKVQFDMINHDNPVFKFSLTSSFGKPGDLTAMAALIRNLEFSPVIEKAFTAIPTLEEKDMNDFGSMTQFLFRSMYKTTYRQGSIESALDTTSNLYTSLELGKPEMREALKEKIETEDMQMMKACNFTTFITLPAAPKEIKGAALTKGNNDKQLVLKGNILEMIKDPQQYEYSISY